MPILENISKMLKKLSDSDPKPKQHQYDPAAQPQNSVLKGSVRVSDKAENAKNRFSERVDFKNSPPSITEYELDKSETQGVKKAPNPYRGKKTRPTTDAAVIAQTRLNAGENPLTIANALLSAGHPVNDIYKAFQNLSTTESISGIKNRQGIADVLLSIQTRVNDHTTRQKAIEDYNKLEQQEKEQAEPASPENKASDPEPE